MHAAHTFRVWLILGAGVQLSLLAAGQPPHAGITQWFGPSWLWLVLMPLSALLLLSGMRTVAAIARYQPYVWTDCARALGLVRAHAVRTAAPRARLR